MRGIIRILVTPLVYTWYVDGTIGISAAHCQMAHGTTLKWYRISK